MYCVLCTVSRCICMSACHCVAYQCGVCAVSVPEGVTICENALCVRVCSMQLQ